MSLNNYLLSVQLLTYVVYSLFSSIKFHKLLRLVDSNWPKNFKIFENIIASLVS